MTFDRCAKCPVLDGACYARRKNLRRMCELAEYDGLLEALGDRKSVV